MSFDYSKIPVGKEKLFSLMVMKLPIGASKCKIQESFANFGQIADIHIPFDKKSNTNCDYAFVRFYNESDMSYALRAEDVRINGCKVHLANANPVKGKVERLEKNKFKSRSRSVKRKSSNFRSPRRSRSRSPYYEKYKTERSFSLSRSRSPYRSSRSRSPLQSSRSKSPEDFRNKVRADSEYFRSKISADLVRNKSPVPVSLAPASAPIPFSSAVNSYNNNATFPASAVNSYNNNATSPASALVSVSSAVDSYENNTSTLLSSLDIASKTTPVETNSVESVPSMHLDNPKLAGTNEKRKQKQKQSKFESSESNRWVNFYKPVNSYDASNTIIPFPVENLSISQPVDDVSSKIDVKIVENENPIKVIDSETNETESTPNKTQFGLAYIVGSFIVLLCIWLSGNSHKAIAYNPNHELSFASNILTSGMVPLLNSKREEFQFQVCNSTLSNNLVL